MSEKDFAILVINYNGKEHLEGCFKSLSLMKEASYDIFLVDNGSSDGSREFTKKNFNLVKIVNTGSNLGFSGAYNYIHKYITDKKLRYKYYFILNNDTVCNDDTMLARVKRNFDLGSDIGIVAPTIIGQKNLIQLQGGDYLFISGTTFGHNNGKKFKKKDELIMSKWASGCAFFIRRNFFDKIGGFDDYFMYQEDVGLSWKTLNQGYKIVTDCMISVIHFGGGTAKPSDFEHYYSERNRLIMYWQNLSTVSFLIQLPLFLFMRIIILLKQGSFKIALAKVRGLKEGFFILRNFPKNNQSIKKDIKAVKEFNRKINNYESPVSNS